MEAAPASCSQGGQNSAVIRERNDRNIAPEAHIGELCGRQLRGAMRVLRLFRSAFYPRYPHNSWFNLGKEKPYGSIRPSEN
jgi:hypothetical protein